MADHMEWTPTGPSRGIKRLSDGTMILESPGGPYDVERYMPGGWPKTPRETRYFNEPQPRPILDNHYLASAKRICTGIRACARATATSIRNMIQRAPRMRMPLLRFRQAPRASQSREQSPRPSPEPTGEPVSYLPTPPPEPIYFGPQGRVDPDSGYSSDVSDTLKPKGIPRRRKPSPQPDRGPTKSAVPSPISDISSTVPSPSTSPWFRRWRELPTVERQSIFQQPTPPLITPGDKVKARTPKSSPHSDEALAKRSTRSLAKELLREAESQYYNIVSLSQEWEDKIEHALKHGNGNYKASDFVRVVPPAGSRGTDSWLNDEVINGYLKIVCDHGNKDNRPDQVPRYHAFSSFFMTNLMDVKKGPASVKRWATRAKIGGKNLLQVDRVFIPINSGAHWTMLVVSPKLKNISYYDSMAGNGMKYIRYVIEWLKAELGKDFEERDWLMEPAVPSPQQTNYSDCGVFAITSAKHIMLGQDVMAYGSADIPIQRRRIVAEILAKALIRN